MKTNLRTIIGFPFFVLALPFILIIFIIVNILEIIHWISEGAMEWIGSFIKWLESFKS